MQIGNAVGIDEAVIHRPERVPINQVGRALHAEIGIGRIGQREKDFRTREQGLFSLPYAKTC